MRAIILRISSCATALCLFALDIQGAVLVTLREDGDNLIVSTDGGSLDLTGLSFRAPFTGLNSGFSGISHTLPGFWGGGSAGISNAGDEYRGAIDYIGDPLVGTFFGSDNTTVLGDFFGVFSEFNSVFVPTGFTSGDSISASSIAFNDKPLAHTGLSVGSTVTWAWAGDSITLTAVPEVDHYAIGSSLLLLGFALWRRRSRDGAEQFE